MQLHYSESDEERVLLTLKNIDETISQLVEWNVNVKSAESYYGNQHGMQLLAANCTLITAIGEGINRINRVKPDFLNTHFPDIPWRAVIGMRNHIAHGYFEIDADLVYDAVKNDIPILKDAIGRAIRILEK